MLSETYSGNSISDITTSVNNHLVSFAAENSRLTNTVVDMAEYKEYLKKC